MAEFHFYGTFEDWWLYIDALAQLERYTFVVHLDHSAPTVLKTRSLTDDLKSAITNRGQFFLWSDEYSTFPPYLDKVQESYWMDLGKSGPAMQVVGPHYYQKDNIWCLNIAWLTYQREGYCNPETDEWYRTPTALRDDFLAVRKILQKLMVKRYAPMTQQVYEKKAEIKIVWIGPDALKLLEEDKLQLRIYTDFWRGWELKRKREPRSEETQT